MFFAGLSPRRRALFAALAVLALAGAGLAGGKAWQARVAGIPAPDRPGTVVLVPGFGGGVGALDTLAARVRSIGREARVVSLPGGGVGDLNEQAAALDDVVARALRDGAPSVDVIGYSAGGVVARLWVQSHDGAHKARRIVTLGSPHHGASIAAAGTAAGAGACPTACQQLAPGSRLLQGLSGPVQVPPAWLSLWTNDDQTVTPPDSARLEGAVNVPVQSLCPGLRVSHSELPVNGFVTALVLNAIGPKAPAEPNTVACLSS